MQVKIEVIEGTVHVVGPYSTENNDVWRSLGGKFTGGRWVLPDNETTRQKIAAMFGTKSEEVEVLVPNERLTDGEIVQIGGYVLAQRRGRDSRVEMPDGVSLAAGYFPSSRASEFHELRHELFVSLPGHGGGAVAGVIAQTFYLPVTSSERG